MRPCLRTTATSLAVPVPSATSQSRVMAVKWWTKNLRRSAFSSAASTHGSHCKLKLSHQHQTHLSSQLVQDRHEDGRKVSGARLDAREPDGLAPAVSALQQDPRQAQEHRSRSPCRAARSQKRLSVQMLPLQGWGFLYRRTVNLLHLRAVSDAFLQFLDQFFG